MITFNPHPSVLKPAREQLIERVSLPHLYIPRHYQEEDLFRQLFPHHYSDLDFFGIRRKSRILLLWHRRAGKDLSSIAALSIAAYEEPGNYLHLLPEQTQAKKIIWRGIDKDGIRFRDRFPPGLIKKIYEAEMLIEYKNGSTVQLGGADMYNSWMGTNPRGIIFSEYSLQDPLAWQYFRPILAENGGWAVFIYTARGKNHGWDLYNIAKKNPKEWALSRKDIDQTFRPDGTPVISQAAYRAEIRNGMPEQLARQEFYLDFTAALVGSIFGDLMEEALLDKRIGFFPHNPDKKVYTAWDLGLDANCVIFSQRTDGGDPRIIDYLERPNEKFSNICKEVLQKPYIYGAHFPPHDVGKRDPEKVTRVDIAEKLGINFEPASPKYGKEDSIELARGLIPRTQFNETGGGEDNSGGVERLIDAMTSHRREYDDKLKTFKINPVHDWASHGSDTYKTLAINWDLTTDTDWWMGTSTPYQNPCEE